VKQFVDGTMTVPSRRSSLKRSTRRRLMRKNSATGKMVAPCRSLVELYRSRLSAFTLLPQTQRRLPRSLITGPLHR